MSMESFKKKKYIKNHCYHVILTNQPRHLSHINLPSIAMCNCYMTTMFGSRAALRSQTRFLSAPTRPISRLTSPPSSLPRHTSTVTYANASSKRSIWLRRLAYATIFGGLGMLVGQRIEEKVAAPPVPGSLEDKIVMEELLRIYERAIPIVMELRSNPDYEESDVYQNYSEEENSHRLTAGPLRGSRGLALQVGFSSCLAPAHAQASRLPFRICKTD